MSESIKKTAARILIIAFFLAMVAFPSVDGRQGAGQAGEFTNIPDTVPGMFLMQKSDSHIVHAGLLSVMSAAILAGFDGIKCAIISIYSKSGKTISIDADSLLRLGCLLQI